MKISLRDVEWAQERISPLVRWSPLLECPVLSRVTGTHCQLKLETVQETQSFKIRGAANKILSLSAEDQARGVVTLSTGNHGRAVAYVARHLGIPAVICISKQVPSNKVEALKELGVELVIAGDSQDEAGEVAQRLAEERGLSLVHPFDDPEVIAGQGTLGLEIFADQPEVDTVWVPLSGGGLISGVALALKALRPSVRVVGVSMQEGAAMIESLKQGRPKEVAECETLADSLRGGVGVNNQFTYSMCHSLVDEWVQVSEVEIRKALRFAFLRHQLVLEGAAAVGIAAVGSGRVALGEHNVILLTGSNIDPHTWLKSIAEE